VSWTGRLANLQTYFWPKLFSGGNFLLGVRPAARIPVATQATGYVWIESGYTWLLWAGGIPLLAGFVFLACAAARRGWRAARGGMDGLGGAVGSGGTSVAGIALFTSIAVISALMTFDPHLTYRGTGDAFFTLLALAAPRMARAGETHDAPTAAPARRTPPGPGATQHDPAIREVGQ
jgi:hypothetical protein